jgi:hypothetical protein
VVVLSVFLSYRPLSGFLIQTVTDYECSTWTLVSMKILFYLNPISEVHLASIECTQITASDIIELNKIVRSILYIKSNETECKIDSRYEINVIHLSVLLNRGILYVLNQHIVKSNISLRCNAIYFVEFHGRFRGTHCFHFKS